MSCIIPPNYRYSRQNREVYPHDSGIFKFFKSMEEHASDEGPGKYDSANHEKIDKGL